MNAVEPNLLLSNVELNLTPIFQLKMCFLCLFRTPLKYGSLALKL